MTRRPTPHRAKVAFLNAKLRTMRYWLRRLAVVQVHRLSYGGGTVHTAYRCNVCDTDWDVDAPEHHRNPECPCK